MNKVVLRKDVRKLRWNMSIRRSCEAQVLPRSARSGRSHSGQVETDLERFYALMAWAMKFTEVPDHWKPALERAVRSRDWSPGDVGMYRRLLSMKADRADLAQWLADLPETAAVALVDAYEQVFPPQSGTEPGQEPEARPGQEPGAEGQPEPQPEPPPPAKVRTKRKPSPQKKARAYRFRLSDMIKPRVPRVPKPAPEATPTPEPAPVPETVPAPEPQPATVPEAMPEPVVMDTPTEPEPEIPLPPPEPAL